VIAVVWILGGLTVGLVLGGITRAPSQRDRGKARAMSLAGSSEAVCSLDDIVEALRAAALRVIPRLDGVTIIDQIGDGVDRLELRVADPKRVTISTLHCAPTPSSDLPFSVAIALTSVFGPLQLTCDTDTFEVDGTKDRHAMMRELSRRNSEKLEALLAARSTSA